ncbi:hypothetical protein BT96DRAFT_1004520 [Gymnopus androsaceus JB14]|uniref:Uncharacterized protein n=1 Tax=Gymnopus androsaceus JB14 TaxID=1447944 RepID=A0A6A4GSH6_9AGAR|nr:hypothetical protein BT96DRAFT_1004520 [Gymnopus androsaceus JB14]
MRRPPLVYGQWAPEDDEEEDARASSPQRQKSLPFEPQIPGPRSNLINEVLFQDKGWNEQDIGNGFGDQLNWLACTASPRFPSGYIPASETNGSTTCQPSSSAHIGNARLSCHLSGSGSAPSQLSFSTNTAANPGLHPPGILIMDTTRERDDPGIGACPRSSYTPIYGVNPYLGKFTCGYQRRQYPKWLQLLEDTQAGAGIQGPTAGDNSHGPSSFHPIPSGIPLSAPSRTPPLGPSRIPQQVGPQVGSPPHGQFGSADPSLAHLLQDDQALPNTARHKQEGKHRDPDQRDISPHNQGRHARYNAHGLAPDFQGVSGAPLALPAPQQPLAPAFGVKPSTHPPQQATGWTQFPGSHCLPTQQSYAHHVPYPGQLYYLHPSVAYPHYAPPTGQHALP